MEHPLEEECIGSPTSPEGSGGHHDPYSRQDSGASYKSADEINAATHLDPLLEGHMHLSDPDAKSSALKALSGVSRIVSKSRQVDAQALEEIKKQRSLVRLPTHGHQRGLATNPSSSSGEPPSGAGEVNSPRGVNSKRAYGRSCSNSSTTSSASASGILSRGHNTPMTYSRSNSGNQTHQGQLTSSGIPSTNPQAYSEWLSHRSLPELLALQLAVQAELEAHLAGPSHGQNNNSSPLLSPSAANNNNFSAAMFSLAQAQAQLQQEEQQQAFAIQQALAMAAGVTLNAPDSQVNSPAYLAGTLSPTHQQLQQLSRNHQQQQQSPHLSGGSTSSQRQRGSLDLPGGGSYINPSSPNSNPSATPTSGSGLQMPNTPESGGQLPPDFLASLSSGGRNSGGGGESLFGSGSYNAYQDASTQQQQQQQQNNPFSLNSPFTASLLEAAAQHQHQQQQPQSQSPYQQDTYSQYGSSLNQSSLQSSHMTLHSGNFASGNTGTAESSIPSDISSELNFRFSSLQMNSNSMPRGSSGVSNNTTTGNTGLGSGLAGLGILE